MTVNQIGDFNLTSTGGRNAVHRITMKDHRVVAASFSSSSKAPLKMLVLLDCSLQVCAQTQDKKDVRTF